jgi:hypothetical protein
MVKGLMSNNNYRFDNRTKKQFKQDIKDGHQKEADIAVRLCIYKKNQTGNWPILIPTGIDVSGNYIEDSKNINSTPDFKIDDNYIEITRADVSCKYCFHQKESKIISCIKNRYNLAFIDGYNTENTRFIILNPDQIRTYTNLAKENFGEVLHPGAGKTGKINKTAYKYKISWFENLWQVLPRIEESIPKEYEDIINLTMV